MFPRLVSIQSMLKVKVKVKGYQIWAHLFSRISLLIVSKWPVQQ